MFAAVFLKVYGAIIRKRTAKVTSEITAFDWDKSSLDFDNSVTKEPYTAKEISPSDTKILTS